MPNPTSTSSTRPSSGIMRSGARTHDVDDRLRKDESGEDPERELDDEVAGIEGVRERLEQPQRGKDKMRAANDDEQRPGHEAKKCTQASEQRARGLRIVTRERVSGEMRVCARCGGEGHGDVKREQPLAQVVRLARPSADEVAQRPLEKQERDN